MVLHSGVGLQADSFQVSVFPQLWTLFPQLQQKKTEEDLEKEKDYQWSQV